MKDDTNGSDITRTLIKALPRLFTKHQTDVVRTCDILRLVQTMKLDMYMELRMVSVSVSYDSS
jgi:cohesin complex subunit SA-1/2